MNIKQLDSNNKKRWDEFVCSQNNGTFFHLAGWKDVIEKAFGHNTFFIYTEENGVITGVLPLAQVKSFLFGNSLVSLPFCVYGGILASSDEAYCALENAAIEKAKEKNVDHLELRFKDESKTNWKSKDLYVTFRKEIDPDVEQNLKNIPRKQRAMVRKGIKADLTSEIDRSVDRFYEAYARSVHALGTPVFSKKYFQVLMEEFGDRADILTITKDGRLISSVLSFYFKDEVLPYYGGGTSEARAVKGNDFMYWELMRRSCEKGIKVFDYGRSKEGAGSYSFKKNWGFEPVPLHYQYYLVKAKEVPDLNPMNPKLQMFIKAWQKMPFAMTKIIGPGIVKSLG